MQGNEGMEEDYCTRKEKKGKKADNKMLPFFRRQHLVWQMRFHPMLPSGLPTFATSTAVMSLNFASLNQQPTLVPALNPLNYCLAFPNSGVWRKGIAIMTKFPKRSASAKTFTMLRRLAVPTVLNMKLRTATAAQL
jgi:hypothetical protein